MYLYYCLKTLQPQIQKLRNQNAQPNINQTKLKNVFIPIPKNPHDEQKIVQYLEEKMDFHRKYWEHLKEIM